MSTNNQTDGNKPALTPAQKQKMKKYAVYALMFIIFGVSMRLLFAPSQDDKAKSKANRGFNTDIPLPKEEGLIGDKRDAYEKEQMKQKQTDRMRSLQDFSTLLGTDSQKTNETDLTTEAPARQTGSDNGRKSRPQSSVQTSAQAYQNMNRTLGTFYEQPKVDPEKEKLKQDLEALKARMNESESRKNEEEKQLALMEKSFQMAAKYMPGTSESNVTPAVNASNPATGQGKGNLNGKENTSPKAAVIPVSGVREQTVSVLQQEMTGAEFIETYGQPRNPGFLTAAGSAGAAVKNTVSACIHDNQTVTDGQSIRLRLLEPMRVGNTLIPHNTLMSGTAKIQGERLTVTVNFLEYVGAILPVDLKVYDLDGQEGIFIPNLQELNAAKEIVANMGTSAGTSITLSNDAGKQFAADMGRNLIQGVSQFASKKLREVKVHLKAGYRVFLLPTGALKNNQPQLASNQ